MRLLAGLVTIAILACCSAWPKPPSLCAASSDCPEHAPLCVDSGEGNGYCAAACERDEDCVEAGATCLYSAVGHSSPVRVCGFPCGGCPDGLACDAALLACFPAPLPSETDAAPEYSVSLGGTCSAFIDCAGGTCLSSSHALTYGFCSRACSSDDDCVTADARGACDTLALDIPGIGAALTCSFHCGDCPASLHCDDRSGLCVPRQPRVR